MKRLRLYHVSLQVTSPKSRKPNLKHQVEYLVRAFDATCVDAIARGYAERDGHTVVSTVSVQKGMLLCDGKDCHK